MIKEAPDDAPKLRFPEFNKEWKLRRAGDYFSNSRKKGEEGLPIYSVTQDDGLVRRDSLDRQIGKDAGAEKNLRAVEGDLVYNTMRMWQGAVGIANEQCMVSPAYIVLHPKKTANSKFFLYHFDRARSLYLLWAYSYGLTNDRLRLYFKDFAFIEFAAPCPEEQGKIASFLVSVDEKITLLEKKRTLLAKYKKGAMQQIFSQQIRFKDDDGNDFPDWGQKRLEELGDLKNGFNAPKEDFGHGFPFVNLMDIFGKAEVGEPELHLVHADAKDLENYGLKVGDVLFVRSSVKRTGVGTTCVVNKQLENTIYSGFVIRFRERKKLMTVGFKKYVFWTDHFRRQVLAVATTSANTNVNQDGLSKLSVQIPHVSEQKKIADFLSAIDEKIKLVGQQITHMRDFKKGLLQQMFV